MHSAPSFAATLLAFARKHRRVVWPGYTHQRIAMPSSAGAWAAAYAEGLLDAADGVLGFWARLDRSPLGSAAGYGVPLPLNREAAARALGFRGIDQVVTTTQNARGVLEAQVLFWCLGAAHECAKLAADVILFSADEFGWLSLPAEWSTGSSIMPQKRNPDLFELTRARAAALEGDLATVMALKAKLAGGYHRDFQLLKAPLWRGIDRTRELLTVLRAVMPQMGVDAARGIAALRPEVFATDEVMRRVGTSVPFRRAYRDVADGLRRGVPIPALSAKAITATRISTGGLGNLPLVRTRFAIANVGALVPVRAAQVRRGDHPARGNAAAMSHERRQRHLKILELVATRPLRTQDELADALNREGWEVTQSSVSRDIAALGLIKIDGLYRRPAAAHVHELIDPNERRLAESLLSVEPAGDALAGAAHASW